MSPLFCFHLTNCLMLFTAGNTNISSNHTIRNHLRMSLRFKSRYLSFSVTLMWLMMHYFAWKYALKPRLTHEMLWRAMAAADYLSCYRTVRTCVPVPWMTSLPQWYECLMYRLLVGCDPMRTAAQLACFWAGSPSASRDTDTRWFIKPCF